MYFLFSILAPEVPPTHNLLELLPDAISIAIVAYGVNVSMAKIFAKKHGYEIDPNQVSVKMLLTMI